MQDRIKRKSECSVDGDVIDQDNSKTDILEN